MASSVVFDNDHRLNDRLDNTDDQTRFSSQNNFNQMISVRKFKHLKFYLADNFQKIQKYRAERLKRSSYVSNSMFHGSIFRMCNRSKVKITL